MPTAAKLTQNSLLMAVQAINSLYSVLDPDTDNTLLAINRPLSITGALTVSGAINGTASSALALKTARVISATGDATGAAPAFDGSVAVAIPLTLATVNTAPVSAGFAKVTTNAKGLVTSTAPVVAGDITPLLNSVYVSKAGDTLTGPLTGTSFVGPLSGNASTATALQTARTLSITGDASWSTSFDGSANATAALTLANVNTNVGSFGSTTFVPVITVDAKGRITAISTAAIPPQTPAAAGTLTGTTLSSSVVSSSLTSVGTLGSLAVTGGVTAESFTGPLTGNVTGAASLNVLKAGDTVTGRIISTFNEGLRLASAGGYISGYDSTGATRQGFLQFNTGTTGTTLEADGTNPITFLTGATTAERMRIDAAGNVGIGTAPITGSRVNILANGTTQGGLAISGVPTTVSAGEIVLTRAGTQSAAVGNGAFIQLGNTTSATYAGIQEFQGGLQFFGYTGGVWSERMRLDSLGSLSIGTAASSSINFTVSSSTTGRAAINAGAPGAGYISLFNNFSGAADVYGMPTGTAGLATYPTSSQPIVFGTTGAERMRVGVNGYVGIGNTTPLSLLSVGSLGPGTAEATNKGTIQIGSNGAGSPIGGGGLEFKASNSGNGFGWSLNSPDLGNNLVPLCFSARVSSATWTEIMRLDGFNYYACFGGTTAANGINPPNGVVMGGINGSTQIGIGHPTGTVSGTTFLNFNYNAAGIGSITQNGTTSVSFNTTSDERRKENIGDAPSAKGKIDAMKVRSFNWKEGGEKVEYGMIAQELVDVAPEAVHVGGEDADKNPWGVDYSKLVPLLIKQLQEQSEELNNLKTRLTQLESKAT